MTDLQLDTVRDEVSIMLAYTIRDYHDRHEVVDLILDDVVADIEETADWSDYEDEDNPERWAYYTELEIV